MNIKSNNNNEDLGKTEVIYGLENAIRKIFEDTYHINEKLDIYIDSNGLYQIISTKSIKDNLIRLTKKKTKIRCIAEITKDNIDYVKVLTAIVEYVRHLNDIKGNFGLTESRYVGNTIAKQTQPLMQLIVSNVEPYIEQQQYFFNMLWDKAITAEQRISELEKGEEREIMENIFDLVEVGKKVFYLLNSCSKEILVMFATSNAFQRQKRTGSIQRLKDIKSKRPDLIVKVLTPKDSEVEKEASILRENFNIEIRFIEPLSRVSILIVDRKYYLTAELKDDAQQTYLDAIGLATFSNNKSALLSYVSIFDNLWKQTELYDQLKMDDEMQKDFINMAIHEIRNPVQPILSLTNILNNKTKDFEQKELLDIVIRNTKKLQKLTEDILDISKIERKSLRIEKEEFDINSLIKDTTHDFGSHIGYRQKKISFETNASSMNEVLVYADKNRIFQVLSNLISNSIKFISEEGTISINVEVKERNQNLKEMVIINVRDTGIGIDNEILPRLFTKFTTKSFQGNGLGLYISKSIVEAHGGKIWAKNNLNGKGAEFSFSLPVNERLGL